MTTDPSPAADTPELPPPRSGGGVALGLAVGFAAALGLLLASFPVRHADVWSHLTAGRRALAGSAFSPTWLYDTLGYAVYSVAGGTGLVGVKAGLVAVLSGLLVVLCRVPGGGWRLPLACSALAVLAVSARVLLQPVTLAYLWLALVVWHLYRAEKQDETAVRLWPGWQLVLLFVLWANTDRWVVLGLLTVLLAWLGRGFDRVPPGGRGRYFAGRAAALGILLVAAVASPSHVRALRPPSELLGELATGTDAVESAITSPFSREYVSAFGDSPAALAYYPLLGLGAVSFLLVRRGRVWERLLPWAALAVVSGLQARAVPAFAVVGGPVLAWNLHDYFARRPRPAVGSRAVPVFAAVLGVAFLACAWTGWLQGPPYGPRRWGFELPSGIESAAATVRGWHADGTIPPGSKTAHLSPDTAAGFAWFCPDDSGVMDDRLLDALGTDDAVARFRAAGVDRLVAYVADRRLRAGALERLLDDPDRWPLLHVTGGVAVFGVRGDPRPAAADPYRDREVDLTRLGYRPSDDEKAPRSGPGPLPVPHWSDPFLRPAPARSADRDEAALLLLKAEALRRAAPVRHLTAWEAGHAAGLAAAAAAWAGPGAAPDAAVRLTLLQPPLSADTGEADDVPPATRVVLALQQGFAVREGDVSPGILYAAVRAARRAVADNPSDPAALLVLGQAYQRLLSGTAERAWAARMPQVARLRRVQASWALSRAAALNPESATARYELARVYQSLGCHDLAVHHLRAYRDIVARSDRAADDPVAAAVRAELEQLTRQLDRHTAEYAAEAERMSVADRALAADRRGLAGRALELLMASDLSAFGVPGTRLELDLLLRTGRAHDVQDWTTGTPELRASLGDAYYHWLLAQAFAATGDYAAADVALAGLGSPAGGAARPDHLAAGFARLAGSLVLSDVAAGPSWPHRVVQTFDLNDFSAGVSEVVRALRSDADAATLRGLLALEAGDVDRAREAFAQALRYSGGGDSGRGLEFSGMPIAQSGLHWLDVASGSPPTGR